MSDKSKVPIEHGVCVHAKDIYKVQYIGSDDVSLVEGFSMQIWIEAAVTSAANRGRQTHGDGVQRLLPYRCLPHFTLILIHTNRHSGPDQALPPAHHPELYTSVHHGVSTTGLCILKATHLQMLASFCMLCIPVSPLMPSLYP